MNETFDAWCAVLSAAGFAVTAFLNSPADEAELAAFEAAIGLPMPSDFKSLYRKANGQLDSYSIKSPTPGTLVTPFFGSYDFISLERALEQYRLWMGIYVDAGADFQRNFDHCTARIGDPVYAEYWRPGWVPFSLDGGGNSYAVDLSPAAGGQYGQVILMGPDEDERRVLASSLTELLELAVADVDVGAQLAGQTGIWRLFQIEHGPT